MIGRKEKKTLYGFYDLVGNKAGWICPRSVHERTDRCIRNKDEFLFALALTTIIFGAVISIALAARMEAFL